MSSPTLFTPLLLPCGTQLPNRLAKAAMEENLASVGQLPGDTLIGLYQRWAAGGSGLLITGNVMIDGAAMTGPGGIVLESATPLEGFQRWAKAAKSNGAQVWMQLNHPGRQTYANLGGKRWAPSVVALDLGKHSSRFAIPKAMDEQDISQLIQRFADSARLAEQAGFDGVQIHAAHGYLLSQFLSPLSNQ
ncbi:MAG: 2,4-dienoyl-CoA reductase, partial [Pseudomonadaceae bacterium]|nr:2,4-dienoyl-CoA reductase [Pseudomonadaceae bacterium]